MPHAQLTELQVATYLSMTRKEILRKASRGDIPARKVGDEKFQFRKSDVDRWVWQHIHEFDHKIRRNIGRGVCNFHGLDVSQPWLMQLIPPGGISVPLAAKTKQASIRELVSLADAAELVWAKDDLIDELHDQAAECTTHCLKTIAFPHPAHPVPYDIAESFLVIGTSSRGVPFGSVSGELTELFFLVCCKDEATQLHVLMRLIRMLDEAGVVDSLLAAESPGELRALLTQRELDLLAEDERYG